MYTHSVLLGVGRESRQSPGRRRLAGGGSLAGPLEGPLGKTIMGLWV